MPKEYKNIVSTLIERTAGQLQAAAGDPVKQKQALCRYYRRGRANGFTTGELVDFLGVSDDCVLDVAGLSDLEGSTIMAISDSLTEEEIDQSE